MSHSNRENSNQPVTNDVKPLITEEIYCGLSAEKDESE